MTKCEVCNHPRAHAIMRKVFAGEMTYIEAAQELSLPKSTVFHCFSHHWEMEAKEDAITMRLKTAETVDDYVSILKDILHKLINHLTNEMLIQGAQINASDVTRVTQEVRRAMRDVLEFEGKLKTGPMIQLTVLQTQFTKLMSVLFTELCDNCRNKLLEALPELEAESTEHIKTTPIST